jgi:hypothetical protein
MSNIRKSFIITCAFALLGACGDSSSIEPDSSSAEETTAAASEGGVETSGSSGAIEPTGEGTTGGGPCEDPLAPGCTACDAMGQPQRLFGLTWNFGAAGEGLESEELRCIVPETGASDLIALVPGMDWLPIGMNAYDREAEILYALAFAEADNITRVFSIATITGDLLGNPAIDDQTFNWSGGLYVRSDGALVGVTWNPGAQQEEVRALDPATGTTTLLNVVPEIAVLYQAIYAFDSATDTAFMCGAGVGEGIRLFSIDVMTGSLVGDPVFAAPPPDFSAGLFVRADGQLVGVTIADGMSKLLAIDRATAETTLLAEVPELGPVVLGSSMYDEVTDTIVVVDADNRLVQLDASSGEIVASPTLETPPIPTMSRYNWSGGLHVR